MELTTEQKAILRAAMSYPIQVSNSRVWSNSGRCIGHADDKDLLFAEGLLQKHGDWITKYEITDKGREALNEL